MHTLSEEHQRKLEQMWDNFRKKYSGVTSYTEEDIEKAANEIFDEEQKLAEKYSKVEPIDPNREILGYDSETFEPIYGKEKITK